MKSKERSTRDEKQMPRENYTKLYKVVEDLTADNLTYVVIKILASVTDKRVQLDHRYIGVPGTRWLRTGPRGHDPIGRTLHLTEREALAAFAEQQKRSAESLARQLAEAQRAYAWATIRGGDLSSMRGEVPCRAGEDTTDAAPSRAIKALTAASITDEQCRLALQQRLVSEKDFKIATRQLKRAWFPGRQTGDERTRNITRADVKAARQRCADAYNGLFVTKM